MSNSSKRENYNFCGSLQENPDLIESLTSLIENYSNNNTNLNRLFNRIDINFIFNANNLKKIKKWK